MGSHMAVKWVRPGLRLLGGCADRHCDKGTIRGHYSGGRRRAAGACRNSIREVACRGLAGGSPTGHV